MKRGQKEKGFSLKLGLLGIVAVCWILPMALIFSSIVYYTAQSVRRQFDETMRASVLSAAASCRRSMRAAVESSRSASYDKTVRAAYLTYRNTENSQLLYDALSVYLRENYRYDDNFMTTMIFLSEEPSTIYYTFNPLNGASYSDVLDYRLNVHNRILGTVKELDTDITFISADDGVYLVRNIVDSNFMPYATIVCELNREIIFGSFSGVLWKTGTTVYLNGTPVNIESETLSPLSFPQDLKLVAGEQTVSGEGGKIHIYGRESTDAVDILYAVEVDMQSFLRGFFSFTSIIYILLLLTLPLVLLAVSFFYLNIFRPVRDLTLASGKIRAGDLGYTVQRRVKNREFQYLGAAFNDMSSQLKQQFERIYSEELALRDARIMALQSQINPHFLNNTLEIINWEVRLGNNERVSSLIEALSIMLDAAMDRKNAPLIPLSQEMIYVDSYLYIVSERLGKRLTITKDIDPSVLAYKVPRLIMQPIIENAVEHGVDKRKKGVIEITGKITPRGALLSVRNNTAMSENDRELVTRLLSPEYDAKSAGSLHLGIHNVNTRLKMIYGEDAGLCIAGDGESTVSSFTVPFDAAYPIGQ